MKTPSLILLIIAYLSFISLGLPDAAHGVAWPSVRTAFDIPNSWLGMILVGSGSGYFMSSMFAGKMIDRIGVGMLLAGSSVLVSIGLIGFSLAPVWPLFLVFTIFTGMGSGAIDAGLNTYAAENFSTRHMNWLHAAFGVGAMLGPLIITTVLVMGAKWQVGYLVLGIVLIAMAVLFVLTRGLWHPASSDHEVPKREQVTMKQVVQHPIVILQIVLFFFYTGIEVTFGQWAFTVLTESRQIQVGVAGTWTSLYWGSLALGRFVFGVIIYHFGTDRIVQWSMWSSAVGAIFFSFPQLGDWSLFGLLLIGFSLAPIFPCLVSRTPERVGKSFAPHAIGFQVSAAMLGVMVLPFLSGYLAQWWGMNAIGLFGLAMIVVMIILHEWIMKLGLSNETVASSELP